MREIIPQLTKDLAAQWDASTVAKSEPFVVAKFSELMHYVARLSYLNKDHMLFFRGQNTDYKNKGGASTFYPSIYRNDRLSASELQLRFSILDSSAKKLAEAFTNSRIDGAYEVKRRKIIQWAILQHYEVCATPLMDFTHSLRVACSFAFDGKTQANAYLYLFGLPYLTNRVSVNSEHELINVRLLSICPPDALRPYFQEGYVAGTEDSGTDFSSKSEFDFNRRLIAKFLIPNTKLFWGRGFDPIPHNSLYPKKDRIRSLCEQIVQDVPNQVTDGEIGKFLKLWSQFEGHLMSQARDVKPTNVHSIDEALSVLRSSEQIEPEGLDRTYLLKKFRNQLVHSPASQSSKALSDNYLSLTDLYKQVHSYIASKP